MPARLARRRWRRVPGGRPRASWSVATLGTTSSCLRWKVGWRFCCAAAAVRGCGAAGERQRAACIGKWVGLQLLAAGCPAAAGLLSHSSCLTATASQQSPPATKPFQPACRRACLPRARLPAWLFHNRRARLRGGQRAQGAARLGGRQHVSGAAGCTGVQGAGSRSAGRWAGWECRRTLLVQRWKACCNRFGLRSNVYRRRHDRIFPATRDGPGGIVEALHHFRWVCLAVSRLAGWQAAWLPGCLAAWLAAWLPGWLAGLAGIPPGARL